MVPLPHMIGSQMLATTLYLPKDLYRKIGEMAVREQKAKAQIIREFVEAGVIQKRKSSGATATFFKSLSQLILKGGPKDLAASHDHYTWD